jgi:hypothetical protein
VSWAISIRGSEGQRPLGIIGTYSLSGTGTLNPFSGHRHKAIEADEVDHLIGAMLAEGINCESVPIRSRKNDPPVGILAAIALRAY